MIVKVEKDEDGEFYITLPDSIIKDYNLKTGDTVYMDVSEDCKSLHVFFRDPDIIESLDANKGI